MNPKVDALLDKAKKWRNEMVELRRIVQECGLTEDVKWYQPCYTLQNSNVVIISAFKDYCTLAFFKGALLKDPHGILARPGEVQSGRQIRFTSVQQILDLEPVIRAYIDEAVEVEKAGLTVPKKSTADFEVPEEFQKKLDESPELQAAFKALTPGRQRGYLYHFSAPKLAKTREARVEKCMPRILSGKGLDDE